MQIRCPRCQVLLEIPDQEAAVDLLEVECGACQRRFKLQLNRPSLRVRKPFTPSENTLNGYLQTPPPVAELESILLTASHEIEGRQIERELGAVSSTITLASTEEERETGMLDALARVQNALRAQARAMGADGVVAVQIDPIGTEASPILTMRGTAVRLSPL